MPSKINNFMFKWLIVFRKSTKVIREAIIISQIQHFDADFPYGNWSIVNWSFSELFFLFFFNISITNSKTSKVNQQIVLNL